MRSFAVLLVSCALSSSCDEFNPQLPPAEFQSRSIPLLPVGFPVYPKAFSTESLNELVEAQLQSITFRSAIDDVAGDVCVDALIGQVCLADVLDNALYSQFDNAISEVDIVQTWVDEQVAGSLRFYEPGPIGVGVSEQVGRTIASVVDFTGVEVTARVRNRTDELWGVPIRFSLFMGDSQSVVDRTALVMAIDAAPDQRHTFVLQPGESQEIVLDAPGLVGALNDFRSLSVDYDAVVEVADLEADTFRSWIRADRSDSDGNGVADELATWGLVFEELSIRVSGRGDLDVPDSFPQWMQDLVDGADPSTK